MKYHPTAIARTKPSAPAKWIEENIGFDPGLTLDYGCGRGRDVEHFGIDGYDPNGRHSPPDRLYRHLSLARSYLAGGTFNNYDTILCTYVLNVIPTKEERAKVIYWMRRLLALDGVAYVSVRADKSKLNGWTDKGTYQTYVELDYPIVHRTSGYVIYEVRGGK